MLSGKWATSVVVDVERNTPQSSWMKPVKRAVRGRTVDDDDDETKLWQWIRRANL